MKLLHDIAKRRFPTGKVFTLLAASLLLNACATQQPKHAAVPPLKHTGAEVQVADVDTLAITPEMVAFLERYVLPYENLETRLNLLTMAITSSGVLGFNYDDDRTLTAAEAFHTRSGNCISFANLMVAMAREAGLRGEYQEVVRNPEWSSRGDTLLVVKHINVVISSPRNSYVIDISGLKLKLGERTKMVSDEYAKGLYFNNLGAEALLADELPAAWAYLVKAINAEPELTDPWINLGVVFGRNEQINEARQVYQTALQIDANEYSAMNNLYEVYLLLEEPEQAEVLRRKVEKYRKNNPYYLMMMSAESLEMGRYEESIDLLERAIKKKDNDYQLHFALAKTQYLSGETVAAESSLHRVRELVPQDMLAHYNRSLHELVMEDQEITFIDTPD